MKNVVALAGGVGGAKLVFGLSKLIPKDKFTAIINTADDFEYLGLKICPDIDSVVYSMAGVSDPIRGWGRKNETWSVHESLKKFYADSWFQIGDQDLILHLKRTRQLTAGFSLTEATRNICLQLGVDAKILPMTNEKVSTIINTTEYGELPFQEYFVKYKFKPKFNKYRFEGSSEASLTEETQTAMKRADIIIICPSNPWLSIFPILEIGNTKELIKDKVVIAVSPIVGDSAIKGPAAKIFYELGIKPSAMEVARLYKTLLTGFVLDKMNLKDADEIYSWGIIPFVTETMMSDEEAKIKLAAQVLTFADTLLKD